MFSTSYDNFAKTFSLSRSGVKREEVMYFLKKYFDKINGKKVLDIGCGNGRLIEHFLDAGISDVKYLGIDSSSVIISEAKKRFSGYNFFSFNMLNLDKLALDGFECAFFIASFHHLSTLEERKKVLRDLKKIVLPGSYIFMTNWALESPLNRERYKDSLIKNSQNEFGSKDFAIKIGKFKRFYHSFTLTELKYLFEISGYEIIENRLFENNRNLISIARSSQDKNFKNGAF